MINGWLNKLLAKTPSALANRHAGSFLKSQARDGVRTALSEHSDLTDLVFGNISEGVVIADTAGRLLFFNQAAERILGQGLSKLGPSEWAKHYGAFLSDMKTPYPATDLPLVRALSGDATDQEEIFVRHVHKPEGVWLAVSARSLRDEHEVVRGAVSTFRDITERKKQELELRLGEERIRRIVESAYDAFIAINHHGEVIDCNRQAEATFGWPKAELMGKDLAATLIPERYREAHHAGMRRFLVAGEGPVLGKRLELSALHRDGHEFPVELTISANQLGDAHVFGAFLRDVSENKQAEKLRSLQFATTQILIEAVTVNEAVPRILEAMCRAIGWNIGQLWKVDDYGAEMVFSEGWSEGGEQSEGLLALNRPFKFKRGCGLAGCVWESGKPKWISDMSGEDHFSRSRLVGALGLRGGLAFPVTVGSEVIGIIELMSYDERAPEPGLQSFMADLGCRLGMFIQRKRAEEALFRTQQELEQRVVERTRELAASNASLRHEINERKRLQEEAERINRLKDEFLATVSHELRTPMNVIAGWTELLSKGEVSDVEVPAIHKVLHRNAKAQTQLIEDLLDISRIITGKIQMLVKPMKMQSAVEAAMDSVSFAAQAKSIAISVHTEQTDKVIPGDPGRLQQVLWNLLSNAIKFTPNGGRIDIFIRHLATGIEVAVTDTGQGIEANFLPFVFDRFRQENSRTTRQFGGLGLGLAIAKHIVELHGGTLRCESMGKGKGSTFTISLPVKPDYAALDERQFYRSGQAASAPPLKEGTRRLKGVSILVVDDEPDIRTLLCSILKRHGAEPIAASSAAEALALLNERKPDVILSDIAMPGEDGYALLKKIRQFEAELGRHTPVAALTAYASGDDRRRVFTAGFAQHIAKPVESDTLVKAVQDLIRGPDSGGSPLVH